MCDPQRFYSRIDLHSFSFLSIYALCVICLFIDCVALWVVIYLSAVCCFVCVFVCCVDRLCGLVVGVLGYRSEGSGSIPGTTRKKNCGSGTGSTQPREYNWEATWQKSSGSCLERREYGSRDPSRWPRSTLYPQKLAITSPTSGSRSVGIVLMRTQTMEFSFVCCVLM
jgi:hypothetical protein